MLSTAFRPVGITCLGVFLLCYGTFLRIYPISTQPYWMDEGYTINAALSYAEGHRDGLSAILDSGQTYECFLYCYPTALITNAFGENATNYRIIALIFGLLSIGVVFGFTQSLFSRRIALLTAVLMTFGYFQIAWSTEARWYTMFLCFFWTALWCLYLALTSLPRSKSRTYLYGVLTILTTVLAVFTHKFGILLPFIILGTTVWWFRAHMRINRRNLLLLLSILLATTVLVFALFASYIIGFASRISFHYTLPYYLSFFLREYWALLPLAIYAIVTGGRKVLWLGLIFLSYLIPLVFFTNIVHYRYLFHVTPIIFILAAVGLSRLTESLPHYGKCHTALATGAFLVLFFVSGAGVLVPKSHYWLEADDPSTLGARPSYAYTPQPDWNTAYGYIAAHRTPGDTIISSHPHFTKIFLHEPGYWIHFNYLGIDGRTEYRTPDNQEYYVGAAILDTLDQLQTLTTTTHGYIIYDYMAADGRIEPDILDYIETTYPVVFEKQDNSYSQIWVFKF